MSLKALARAVLARDTPRDADEKWPSHDAETRDAAVRRAETLPDLVRYRAIALLTDEEYERLLVEAAAGCELARMWLGRA